MCPHYSSHGIIKSLYRHLTGFYNKQWQKLVEKNKEDFVGENKSPKKAQSGKERTKEHKSCCELRVISRHIIDYHVQAVYKMAIQFNVPESMIQTLEIKKFKLFRNTENF